MYMYVQSLVIPLFCTVNKIWYLRSLIITLPEDSDFLIIKNDRMVSNENSVSPFLKIKCTCR